MKLEDMKAFRALSDEEQLYKIAVAEAREEAQADWECEPFNRWRAGNYRGQVADCGCGDAYWTATDEAQKDMTICFDSSGKIGSDMWDCLTLGEMTCINCNKKPQMPEWYVEEYVTVTPPEVKE